MAQKIFCIGLSKTGTSSLEEALRILGYSVIAFPQTLKEVKRHQVASDTSVALNFRFLDQTFPGARFIYTLRDPEPWLESCQAMWGRRQGFYDGNAFISQLHQALYGTKQFQADAFRAAYRKHDAKVRGHFHERPADLLALDLTQEKDPWDRLSANLGKAKPDAPFPQANTTRDIAALTARVARCLGESGDTAQVLRLDQAAFHDLVRKGADFAGDRFAPGWEIDLMLRASASRLAQEGKEPSEALGLDPDWFAQWAKRSGYGARRKVLPWLKHGLASRMGLTLGPRTPFFDGADPQGNSEP